jgi:hypothetical protein
MIENDVRHDLKVTYCLKVFIVLITEVFLKTVYFGMLC